MKFEEKTALARTTTGGIKYEPLEDNETLLVCWQPLCQWTEDEMKGYWCVALYPCYYNGKKRFLEESVWQPDEEYSSTNSGKIEKIITFYAGLRLMGKKGTFDWMFQKS